MNQSKVTKTINLPIEQVWEVVADFGNVHYYHPYVESTSLLTENNNELNAERVCHFYDGQNIHEKVTHFEKYEYVEIAILDGLKGPVKNVNGKIIVKKVSDEVTDLSMILSYETKFGIIGSVMNRLIMKSQFRKLINNVLAGLDHYVSTNNRVGRGGKPLTSVEAQKEEQSKPLEIMVSSL
ncbi:MAG: SRPBCC family protein [Candidatus Heimdallarchaeota archaeon]|nr:SRPBCC family protein [Candidatus Heimdallarchaeota archaeon]